MKASRGALVLVLVVCSFASLQGRAGAESCDSITVIATPGTVLRAGVPVSFSVAAPSVCPHPFYRYSLYQLQGSSKLLLTSELSYGTTYSWAAQNVDGTYQLFVQLYDASRGAVMATAYSDVTLTEPPAHLLGLALPAVTLLLVLGATVLLAMRGIFSRPGKRGALPWPLDLR